MRVTATAAAPPPSRVNERQFPLRHVEDALTGMQYGTILLTIHDGKLVQLDVTERRRFTG